MKNPNDNDFDAVFAEIAAIPAVHRIEPATFKPGDTIRLEGRGFSPYLHWNRVWIAGQPAELIEGSTTELNVKVPDSARDIGLVEIEVGGRVGVPATGILEADLRIRTCGRSADAIAEILGTSEPRTIVVRHSSTTYGESVEFVTSRYYCGENTAFIQKGAMKGQHYSVSHSLPAAPVMALGAMPSILPVGLLFSVVVIDVVRREVTDPKTGEVHYEYYFYRDGKWWRILDPDLRHPDYPDLFDLEDESDRPNFEPAGDEEARRLDGVFFPSGWELFWRAFDESMHRDLQLLAAMAAMQVGLEAEDLELLEQIREMSKNGHTIEEIWDAKQDRILYLILFGLVGVAATGAASMAARRLLGRLFRKMFRRLWIRRIRRVKETENSIEVDVHPDFRPRGGQGGVQGGLRGTVNRGTNTLDSDYGAEEWINSTGRRGLATDIMSDFIDVLVDFARRKGLRRVRIRRVASTEEGAGLLRRNGFQPVRVDENGIGLWERIIEVS